MDKCKDNFREIKGVDGLFPFGSETSQKPLHLKQGRFFTYYYIIQIDTFTT